MKKILVLFTVALLLMTLAVGVSAKETVDVVVKGDKAITNDTYSVQVTVENIKYEDGIIFASIFLNYDADVLEVESVTPNAIDGWNMDSNYKQKGVIALYPTEADGDSANAVKKSGEILYKITFKVKSRDKDSVTISVDKSSVVTDKIENEGESISGCGSVTAAIVKPLKTPSGVKWDGDKAKWDAVEGAADYSVQFYKNTKKFGDPIKTGGSTEYLTDLTESGSYTFTVTAIAGNDGTSKDSEPSSQSDSRVVVGTLAVPKIELTSDKANGGIKYQIVDTNNNGTVKEYIITLYSEGNDTPIATVSTTSRAGNVPNEHITYGTSYLATVQAISSDTAVNFDSEISGKTPLALAVNVVTKIEILSKPRAEYKEGENLDLSGTKIRVTYKDGTSKELSPSEFTANGITASIKNGTQLKLSQNKKKVELTASTGKVGTVTLITLSVAENVCDHVGKEEQVVHVDPTCVEDGYDSTICKACGAEKGKKIIPATSEHIYGDWQVQIQPTETQTGLKIRVCTGCEKLDQEPMPALSATGTTGALDTPADTSQGEGDTPNADVSEDDESRKLNDLSKIFLIAIIVIFALIMLFMIFGVWSSNKRSRERQMRNRSSRK